MARVNVEETTYEAALFLAEVLSIPYPQAIGHLVLLWHKSQDKLRIAATGEEICRWARVRDQKEQFIEALLQEEFLKMDDGKPSGIPDGIPGGIPDGILKVEFIIAGNQKHVKLLKRLREQSTIAIETRWKKHRERLKKEGSIPDGIPQGIPEGIPGAYQKPTRAIPISIQFNTIQKKEEYSVGDSENQSQTSLALGNEQQAGIEPSAKQIQANGKDGATDGKIFIGAYVKAYQTKYQARPTDIQDPKVLGRIKRFLKGCPIEKACELIQVYLQMEDKWFDRKGHDIETFLNNLNPIGRALATGHNPNFTDWAAITGTKQTQQ